MRTINDIAWKWVQNKIAIALFLIATAYLFPDIFMLLIAGTTIKWSFEANKEDAPKLIFISISATLLLIRYFANI